MGRLCVCVCVCVCVGKCNSVVRTNVQLYVCESMSAGIHVGWCVSLQTRYYYDKHCAVLSTLSKYVRMFVCMCMHVSVCVVPTINSIVLLVAIVSIVR